MKLIPFACLLLVGLAGCQSQTEPGAEPVTTISEPGAPAADKAGVAAGMEMDEVKKLKGAPKEVKHEHGPNESEVDIWIYEDETVKFVNGKVEK